MKTIALNYLSHPIQPAEFILDLSTVLSPSTTAKALKVSQKIWPAILGTTYILPQMRRD